MNFKVLGTLIASLNGLPNLVNGSRKPSAG